MAATTSPKKLLLLTLVAVAASTATVNGAPTSRLRSRNNTNKKASTTSQQGTTTTATKPKRKQSKLHHVLQIGQPPKTLQKRRELQEVGSHSHHHGRNLQGEDGYAPQGSCTDTVPHLIPEESLKTGECIEGWNTKEWQFYPYDFQGLTNEVQHYTCPTSGKRIIASNGIPDHAVRIESVNMPCEKFWYLELPLEPEYLADTIREPAPMGLVAMAMNGIPMFGALEVFGGNAVEPDMTENKPVLDARFWYGHATGLNIQHYHNPHGGRDDIPTDLTLMGYALDGFPVYGPLADDSVLDECNGVFDSDGNYRYHVRSIDQVDDAQDYCSADANGNNQPNVQWNYIVGCFHGNLVNSKFQYIQDMTEVANILPTDCVLEDYSEEDPAPIDDTRPNIIIIQPDDLPFYEAWTPPPNNPGYPGKEHPFPANFTMPNIERLRTQGLEMTQAYTTSPGCGTSRYSTITGKYASRSSYSRSKAIELGNTAAKVNIPRTKLEDLAGYANDCTEENLITVFQNNGYRTGVTGKWHLALVDDVTYSYNGYRDQVKNCGFDFAEALFAENLDADVIHGVDLEVEDQKFSHNMEWVTHEAINFINGDYAGATQEDTEKPFLLYFNPTVPHSSGSVEEALTEDKFVCTVTADVGNPLPSDPLIKGMTLEYGGCVPYRETIGIRAGGIHNSNSNLGAVWVDDSVGALLHALIDKGIYENTIILFQIDHGVEGKQTLFENGNRIVQFIHYPNDPATRGATFDGLVSTIDIAATMFDYAGIESPYALDGQSWADAIGDVHLETKWKDDRCLLFENQFDRAVRCGCGKYMTMRDNGNNSSNTLTMGELFGFNTDAKQFIDLCDAQGEYIDYPQANPEAINIYEAGSNRNDVLRMYQDVLGCFRTATDPVNPDFNADCSSVYDSDFVKTNMCQSDSDCANHPNGNHKCDTAIRVCVQCPNGANGGQCSD